MKNVAVLFDAKDFTHSQYDQAWEALKAAGYSHPKGLLSHVGFDSPNGGMMVVDIWESAEAFAEFGKTLGPIMAKVGANLPDPKIIPAYYVYLAQTEMA
jgi:hypothetical protein